MPWPKRSKKTSNDDYDDNILSDSPCINYDDFLIDWENSRTRHDGQKAVISSLFDDEVSYLFLRAGRKFAKTTTLIDIGWRYAHKKPKSVIYLCYPTIAQGIELVWEERRLQTMDRKDEYMVEKYVSKIDEKNHIVWFINGSYVKLIGTWSEAKARGGQPDLLMLDELQDCRSDYLDAMDSNLAAKNAPCIMSGTPPKKRNHYNDWWDRTQANPNRKSFHFTSYSNTALPHLKEWLDNKKKELLQVGREDEWLREYMAEDCFSSSERVLPDAEFCETQKITSIVMGFDFNDRIPILALTVHPTYLCAVFGIMIKGKAMLITDFLVYPQIWNRSLAETFPLLGEKAKELQDQCGKNLRKLVWDPSNAFSDVVAGFTPCRKDFPWTQRGIPLLREMMLTRKIHFSQSVSEFGLECQNMLLEESQIDVQKNYPHACTLAMMVNEYFQREKIEIKRLAEFDKYAGFKEMGIPYPQKKSSKLDRYRPNRVG